MGLFSAAFEAVAPKLAKAGAETLAQRAVVNRVTQAVAGEAGQNLIGKYAGQRAAQFAASKPGQFVIKHEVKQALKRDKETAASTMPAASPAAEPDMNLAKPTTMPGAALKRGAQAYSQTRSRGGGGPSWWQIQPNANSDWRQMEDRSVARGPGSWALPGRRVGSFVTGAGVGALEHRAATKGAQGESTWPAPTPAADWDAPSLPPSGMKLSASSMSDINTGIKSSYLGTNSRGAAFRGGGRLLDAPQPSGPFSTYPKPPTVDQEAGQVTPWKRSGPWVSSAGGSYT